MPPVSSRSRSRSEVIRKALKAKNKSTPAAPDLATAAHSDGSGRCNLTIERRLRGQRVKHEYAQKGVEPQSVELRLIEALRGMRRRGQCGGQCLS